jgi:hypothetical protein
VTAPQAPRWMTYVRLSAVQPALRNPQGHDLEATVEAFQAFGFTDAPIVDERTERLYAGHGRLEGLVETKHRGLSMPEGLMVDDDGEWLVPLQRGWASKDDAHAEAALISHNRLSELGEPDRPLLLSMLDSVQAADPAYLDVLRFDDAFMETLFSEVNLDLQDFTGDPDGPDRAEPKPPRGQDEDTPLDELEDRPAPSTTGDDPVSTQCPKCGHIYPRKV